MLDEAIEKTDSGSTLKWIMTKHEVTGADRLQEKGENIGDPDG